MPPKKKPSTAKPVPAAKAARPHGYQLGPEAHAIVCILRTDKAAAKYWCPSLIDARGQSTVDGNTNADDLFVALLHRCGGELERTRKKAPEGAGKNKQDATPWRIKRRAGRPNAETAVTEAAVQLVQQRGEARVKSAAAKQRRQRSSSALSRIKRIKRRAAPPKVGKFTSRGNAILAVKPRALVEVEQFSSWVAASCRCHCGQPLVFNAKGSVQAHGALPPSLPPSACVVDVAGGRCGHLERQVQGWLRRDPRAAQDQRAVDGIGR